MLVASNTSPIANLAIIDRLDLLRRQFDEIWIPYAVQNELDRLSHAVALNDIQQAREDGWIKLRTLREPKIARLLASRSRRIGGDRPGLRVISGPDFAGRERWPSGCRARRVESDSVLGVCYTRQESRPDPVDQPRAGGAAQSSAILCVCAAREERFAGRGRIAARHTLAARRARTLRRIR